MKRELGKESRVWRQGSLFDVAYGFAGAVDELAHERCEKEEGWRFNEKSLQI